MSTGTQRWRKKRPVARGLRRSRSKLLSLRIDPATDILWRRLKAEGAETWGHGGKTKAARLAVEKIVRRIAIGEINVEDIQAGGQQLRGSETKVRISIDDYVWRGLRALGLAPTVVVRFAIRAWGGSAERRQLEDAYTANGGVGDPTRYSDDFLYLFSRHVADGDTVLGQVLREVRILNDRQSRLEALALESLDRALPIALTFWREAWGARIPTVQEIQDAGDFELRVMLEAADRCSNTHVSPANRATVRGALLEKYYGMRADLVLLNLEEIPDE